MAKRITAERVKKWGIATGAVGVPIGVLLIWFMLSLGVINVTGFSGDVVCDGTELDPCYAYINFTISEDVFIYPSEGWTVTAFSTDIQPGSVQMYRSWGTGWREIKLNQSCTGTWCGLSNSKDERKFAFAFREGRDYQIRYKVLKNSPLDSIKWSFGPVDPVFFGWEDNKLEYSNNDLVVNITDALDKRLGKITLKSHKSVNEIKQFGYGKEEVVMYYDFEGWSEIVDGLGEVNFIDQRTEKEIQKDYHFVEWVSETVTKNIVERVVVGKSANGTNIYETQTVETYDEEIGSWIKLNDSNIPNRNIRIGLKTFVEKNDYIDAVWNIAGKKVEKHAEWTASLNVDIGSFWKLNESSGTLIDSLSQINMSDEGSPLFNQTGIIGTAIGFDSNDDDFINTSASNISVVNHGSTGDFSYSFWMNTSSDEGDNRLFETQGTNLLQCGKTTGAISCQHQTGAANVFLAITEPTYRDAAYHHYVFKRNNSGQDFWLYMDGLLNKSSTGNTADVVTVTDFFFSDKRSDRFINANLDEFGIWNRDLTASEISDLFNGGVGITFTDFFDSEPVVTLISPVDEFSTDINSVTFNFTAFDDSNLTNVSLFGNWTGDFVLNETNTSGINNTFYIFTKTIDNGFYLWGATGTDNSSQTTFSSNRTFTVDRTTSINVSVVLPNGFIRFGGCSPDSENPDSRPQGQTDAIVSINATNNGTITADFRINLTGIANTGWTIIASNNTFTNNITLNTTAQLIGDNIAPDEVVGIHLSANCSFITQNPGVSINIQAF